MVDHIDREILQRLGKNARTPYLQIAKDLEVSESTIRKRVATLEKQGIIQKYSLVIDHAKVGFDNVALVGVDVEGERYLDVAKRLKEFEEVKYVCSSAGDHMFMLKVVAKDTDHLSEVSEKIRSVPGVTRICPAIIKETLKGTL